MPRLPYLVVRCCQKTSTQAEARTSTSDVKTLEELAKQCPSAKALLTANEIVIAV